MGGAKEHAVDSVNRSKASHKRIQSTTTERKMDFTLSQVILSLYDKQVFKFGKFILKSGIESPFYIDLRLIVSYPDLLEQVSALFTDLIKSNKLTCDSICGVPYTALPIATCISTKTKLPMLMRRKEAKAYGTKKLIEGVYTSGDKCLVIEDLVTSGASTLETIEALQTVGLNVTDAVVFLDREQGGKENLLKIGIKLHSVCTMTQLLSILECKMDKETVKRIDDYLSANRSVTVPKEKRRSFKERAAGCKNEMAKKLFELMEAKKTNVAVAIDVTSCEKLLKLADEIGPHVCMVKIHVDILDDFTHDFITKLKNMAEKHNFLIMEDRKFADIGFTVKKQFQDGIYRIAEWADFITAHALPGPGLLDGLKQIGLSKRCSCFLIAQMSSKGTLTTDDYAQATAAMATDDFVGGFITQSRVSDNDSFIHATPGVNIGSSEDSLGQNYVTPSDAIVKRGADLVIVGRGITGASDPKVAALDYSRVAWEAYEKVMSEK